ncbi:hypothetical protein AB0953_23325 [Streptomyces sp. NPDC046866]|uniref:hypothetical protein n=1 Tax=Streptomyces sp. NPDC046866 TaxID=3154921 RepID=UPI0034564325
MGVFDRFFRRKAADATDGIAAEEVTAEKESEETESEETESTETQSAQTQSADSGAAAAEAAGTGDRPAEAQAPAAEAVEIPKQQSAQAAADTGAGESART